MDLVTAEDWCGMLVGGGVHCVCMVCACVLCYVCLECLSPQPVNQKTHRWGRRRKCGEDEKEIQEERRLLSVYFTRTLMVAPGSIFGKHCEFLIHRTSP